MKPKANDSPRLTFHGAAGTVTGSRHLLEAAGRRTLVDCGMFQGLKELRRRNWEAPGFEPGFLDDLILTHSHIDHTGWTPRLMQYGFKGPIHTTPATAELLELVLLDAAHLQEEDAAFANKKGFSKHEPAEPLYTTPDALAALKKVRTVDFEEWRVLSPQVRFRFHNAGHILGSAFVEVRLGGAAPADAANPGEWTIVFGGDLGRYDVPLHVDPQPLVPCDVLIVESTYGNRKHDYKPVLEQIREEFRETVRKRGVVLIPAFAVGRVQAVALMLRELMEDGDLADIPIHIDSPMAVDATEIYSRHLHDGNLDDGISESPHTMFPRQVKLHRTVHDSKMLSAMDGPRVIIASSGMMTGGRILHHLVRRLPSRNNLVLLSGYQAVGTRGRMLQDGAQTLRMHGQTIPVGARVGMIEGLSSHADADEIMRWIGTCRRPPSRVFVVHGEDEGLRAMAGRLEAALPGAEVTIPKLGEGFALG